MGRLRGVHHLWHDRVMNSESELDNTSDVGERPATRADVEEAVDELAGITNRALNHEMAALRQRFDSVDNRLAGVEENIARVERSQATLLDIVQTIDQRLKGAGDIAARFNYLEEKIRTR